MEWIDVWLGIWRVETPVQVVVRVEWLVLGFVVRFWSLIYGRPLTLTLSHGGERGQSLVCGRPILLRGKRGQSFVVEASPRRCWVRAGETGYSFLIQNTASPMSPDHRSSGRFLVGAPFGVSQFLSIVVL